MKKRILVVEDEPSLSMAIRDELEFEGFEASVVEDGITGLDRILAEAPDLVILDLSFRAKAASRSAAKCAAGEWPRRLSC